MKYGNICFKCNKEMTEDDKDYTKNKYFNHCLACYKELRRLSAKKHYEENKEKEQERNKKYREENKERRKKYREENKEKINAARRERYKLKKEENELLKSIIINKR